ncbi:insecticyanin-B [Helicoverpa armigera]|uniref:insecticyanin-B n=1 Tax=Helicoverpa armigera TaxID=29058 RepID=UPI003083751A
MLAQCLVLALAVFRVEGAMMNMSCPDVTPRELDWKALDGIWYLTAIATEDMVVQGDCATVLFDHQNTTDVSISWITNNTVTYYNGSVALIPDPNSNSTGDLLLVTYDDDKTETYSFLDVNYEHYAVIFACYNNDDGNSSTYEIWKLTRTPHLKDTDAEKLDKAIANYSLQDTQFFTFNNTEDTCRVNSGHQLDTSTLVVTSAAALALFRRFY